MELSQQYFKICIPIGKHNSEVFFRVITQAGAGFLQKVVFFHYNLPPHLKHPHDVYFYNFHVFGDLPKRVKVG